MTRVVIGLFKKIVIADTLDQLTLPLFYTADQMYLWNTPLKLVLAIVAYSFKIYVDFSAYSDIAIGSAKVFGIGIPENFNWPYLSHNIADFWQRWHISLYAWVIDYIYIPLGGSRLGFLRTLFNTLIVFSLTGLWHGAAWNFVLWGVYHGVLLCLFRIYSVYVAPKLNRYSLFTGKPFHIASIGATFALVSLGWVFFTVTDFNAIVAVFSILLGFR